MFNIKEKLKKFKCEALVKWGLFGTQLGFLVGKLMGFLAWNWWWVCSPAILAAAVVIVVIAGFVLTGNVQ